MPNMRQFYVVLVEITVLMALGSTAGAREKVILDSDMVLLFDDGVAMMMLAKHSNRHCRQDSNHRA